MFAVWFVFYYHIILRLVSCTRYTSIRCTPDLDSNYFLKISNIYKISRSQIQLLLPKAHLALSEYPL